MGPGVLIPAESNSWILADSGRCLAKTAIELALSRRGHLSNYEKHLV